MADALVEVRNDIAYIKEQIRLKEQQVQRTVGNRQLLLMRERLQLQRQRQLANLQQKELLLMKQQAGAVGRSVPDSLHQLLIKQACSNQGKQHF
jgi:hypothetical protein